MIDVARFKPGTVYVTYIASTPEEVWRALTDPAFTRQYFFGFAVEVEPTVGGAYRLKAPDGKVHVRGEVVDWQPPRRFASTWRVEGLPGYGDLPDCLVTYDIEVSGEAVKLTMMEQHSWDIPEAILAGGRAGWPKRFARRSSRNHGRRGAARSECRRPAQRTPTAWLANIKPGGGTR